MRNDNQSESQSTKAVVSEKELIEKLQEEILQLKRKVRQLKRSVQSKDEQILASEEYGRIVGNFVATCEYWIAPQGELIYISPSCETLTGYPPQMFMENEKLLTDIILEEDLEYVASKRKQAVMENDPHGRLELCFRIRRSNGKERCIKQISWKVYSQDGIFLGRRVSNIDLTPFGVTLGDCRRLER